jgi:hypothetical protein
MSGTLVQSDFTYRSGSAPALYQFTIVSNEVGSILVRDIQDPYGLVVSPYTLVPKSVTDDIATAMSQVEALLSLTSAVNGTLAFVAEAEKTVTFVSPFPNTNYRVQVTSDVFAPYRISSKTTAGFTIQAGASITGSVGYDVLV